MIFHETALQGAYQIDLNAYHDDRGSFTRLFCTEEFSHHGLDLNFVQINHSYNPLKGTLKGMHFQNAPYAEGKLIRCIKGSVQDVVVDLRKESATFLQYISVVLSAEKENMIYIPEGCAHGFITLENNTELIYHHTQTYSPDHEGGFHYNDPTVNIKWMIKPLLVSEKDKCRPFISECMQTVKKS